MSQCLGRSSVSLSRHSGSKLPVYRGLNNGCAYLTGGKNGSWWFTHHPARCWYHVVRVPLDALSVVVSWYLEFGELQIHGQRILCKSKIGKCRKCDLSHIIDVLGFLKPHFSWYVGLIHSDVFLEAFFNPLFGGFQNHHSCTGIAFRRFDGSENGKNGPKSDGYLPTLFSSF